MSGSGRTIEKLIPVIQAKVIVAQPKEVAVEVLRKGSSQEELSRGAAELRPEALRAGVTRESGAVPGPGASLAEALGVMEELGAEVLGPGRREGRSGWLSEPPGFLTGGVDAAEQASGSGWPGPRPCSFLLH